MTNNQSNNLTTQALYKEVKEILDFAKKSAVTAINSSMVKAYWLIGKKNIEEQQKGKKRANYGEELLKTLSKQLTNDFGRGFSYANLKNFRQFYLVNPDFEKSYTLCSKLSWSHNRLIMRVKNKKERLFYLQESFNQNWSVRTLQRQLKTNYYQRLLTNQQPILKQKEEKDTIFNFVKDPYIFEFLGLSENIQGKESVLEKSIINNLQQFLLELGKGFSFVDRQFRISSETHHFYIDLVFYNYLLKCFVVIDLKTNKLTHQDIGQMDMYVRMFDDLKRGNDDNPTIGIILCTDKDETIVKYSVLSENKHLFASKYALILPTEEELQLQLEQKLQLLEGANFEEE